MWTSEANWSVVGEYTPSSVDSHPKYGGSTSRPSVSQSSPARSKLSRLSETQTPHSKSWSASSTGSRTSPRMKKCSPLTTHRYPVACVTGAGSQGRGAFGVAGLRNA